jgi:hypothetical protein
MGIAEYQKEILCVYLNMYRARFELARHQLDGLQSLRPDLERDWVELRSVIDRSGVEYRTQLGRLMWLRQATDNIFINPRSATSWVPEGLQDFMDRFRLFVPGARITKADSDRTSQDTLTYTFGTISRVFTAAPLSETSLAYLFRL